MEIDRRAIGASCAPYIIAEMSGNHGGKYYNAVRLIELAKEIGADAVKLQCYDPKTIAVADYAIKEGPWKGRQLSDLYAEASTPKEWFPNLFDCGKYREIPVFSSVFDRDGVDFLESLNCPAYKISSFDIVDIPLIKYISHTSKPLIISTGMASDEEIMAADDALEPNYPHMFLHCVSGYPTPVSEAKLWRMKEINRMVGLPVWCGLSDHSLGHDVAVAATAMGAPVIEKHLTLDRAAGGPDAAFSMEPQEFREMVSAVHSIWDALHADAASKSEAVSVQFRKSLFWSRNMLAGEQVTETSVQVRRPNLGAPVASLDEVLRKRTRRDLVAGSPVSLDDLSD